MADPAAVLPRMWSWVAPGGVLLVQDYDRSVATSVPARAEITEGIRLVGDALAAGGKDPWVGTAMAGHFHAAGIGAADGVDVFGQILPAATACLMLASVMRLLARLSSGTNSTRLRRSRQRSRLSWRWPASRA